LKMSKYLEWPLGLKQMSAYWQKASGGFMVHFKHIITTSNQWEVTCALSFPFFKRLLFEKCVKHISKYKWFIKLNRIKNNCWCSPMNNIKILSCLQQGKIKKSVYIKNSEIKMASWVHFPLKAKQDLYVPECICPPGF
jgi:hypothetical protein